MSVPQRLPELCHTASAIPHRAHQSSKHSRNILLNPVSIKFPNVQPSIHSAYISPLSIISPTHGARIPIYNCQLSFFRAHTHVLGLLQHIFHVPDGHWYLGHFTNTAPDLSTTGGCNQPFGSPNYIICLTTTPSRFQIPPPRSFQYRKTV